MPDIAAALAVVVLEGRVPLVRRRNRPDAGRWGFPGGKLEPGETAEEAAIRELREETALHARAGCRIGTLRVVTPGPSYVLTAILCRDATGTIRAGDDAEEAAWFPVADVIAGRLIASRDVDRLALRAAARLAGEAPWGRPGGATLRPAKRSL
ncbi:NUDIX hydrolase [Roseivivax isoporae]|uniref:NUDIX hydrolase n=1 Tax=Roseivivax isoporae LMG 25204 TaxID=1449351 RepID=X7F7L9_9RHOB|nr:NUDIX hydrolase [Roseivivax isoporae]ETX28815.1 NUDIX hydrolase [Roseivivax isoporae LMG 25204]